MIYSPRLIAFTLALNLLVGAIAWTSLSNSRERHIHETTITAQDLSRLLISELETEYEKADVVIKTVRDDLELHRNINKSVRAEIETVIQNQLKHNQGLTSIRVTDASGESIYGFTGNRPPQGSSISDRAYFAKLRDDPLADLVVSPPIQGKLTGKWGIALARAIRGNDGKFQGVILAFYNLQSFQDKLAALSLGGQASIAFRNENLELLARHPPLQTANGSFGSSAVSQNFLDQLKISPYAGNYQVETGSIDEVPRFHSYIRSPQYGFYVNVGIAKTDSLKSWFTEIWTTGGMYLVFVLSTVTGAAFLMRSWGRRQKLELEVLRQRDRLQDVIWSADLGTWEWDLTSDATIYNDRWAAMLGYSLEELAPFSFKTFSQLLHPTDAETLHETLQRYLRKETALYQVECRMRHKDGHWIWVLSRGQIVKRASDGTPLWMTGTHQDISGRKYAEERQLYAMAEAAPNGFLLVAHNGSIHYANQVATQIFGASQSELMELNVDALVPGSMRDRHTAMRAGYANNPVSRHMASNQLLMGLHRDGTKFPVEVILNPFTFNGEAMVIASVADITLRIKEQQAIKDNEVILRKAQEIGGFGSYALNFATGTWESSPELDTIFGIDQHFPRTIESWSDLLHPDYRNRAVQHLEEILLKNLPFDLEYEIVRINDGQRRWVSGNGEVERTSGGSPLKMVGSIQDITDRKLIEAELRKSHDLLSKLSDQVPGAVFQFKSWPDGRFTIPFASKGLTAMMGLKLDELQQNVQPLLAKLHPDDVEDFRNSILESEQKQTLWQKEFRAHQPEGDFGWRLGQAKPERQADGTSLWHGFMTDITSRVEIASQMQELNESLESRVNQRTRELLTALETAEHAKRSRGEFLAKMSHEIRTPMNAVLGMVYLALQSQPNEQLRNYLDKIRQSSQHLLGIINDILDYSKIDAGKMALEVGDLDLQQLLQHVNHLSEGKAESKGIAIDFTLAEGTPTRLEGDPLRLGQILINLVDNAIKFTDRGSVKVSVSPQAPDDRQLAQGECMLRFEVADTGLGLSPEQMGRLFQNFEQVDNSITRKYGGTGLGLAISKQLTELMGGQVGVRSVPGEGSVFWFTVRLRLSSNRAEQAFPTDLEMGEITKLLVGKRVLVVDDNSLNLEVASGILGDAGLEVDQASNGALALEALGRKNFDCVLMDVHMPVMDGLEATRRIRSDPVLSGLPVIAMTANARHEDHLQCLETGMNDIVVKPFDPHFLFKTLAKWVVPQTDANKNPMSRKLADLALRAPPSEAEVDPQTLPLWDIKQLVRLVGSNTAVHRRLLEKFLPSGIRIAGEITEAIGSQDWGKTGDLAHELKSSARAVGAMRLGALCAALEHAGRNTRSSECQLLLSPLCSTLGQVEEQIALWLSEHTDNAS
jgi:PAS domain S-box-containing protein